MPLFFLLKTSETLLFTSAANTRVPFRLDFIIEANTMNPDQTAWERSDLGPYDLQYRIPKNISR